MVVEEASIKTEIAFFDVETTVPTRPGQGFAILEFGAILVCLRRLEELQSYTTLVRPSNPNLISSLSVRCNGITPDAVSSAPSFSDIANDVYDILHGRIWAGHNIVRFDCVRIREAFAEIGRPAPEPTGIIDSLALLTQRFGRRAGDMKMASLATYFGLGKQTHRSLDDVRMNLEVLKYCSTVLFLESSLPETFPENSWVSPNATTRSRRNGKISPPEATSQKRDATSSSSDSTSGNHPILSLLASTSTQGFKDSATDPFNMDALSSEMNVESIPSDVAMEETSMTVSSDILSTGTKPEGSSSAGFMEPDEVSVPVICASFVPFSRGGQRMVLMHNDVPLQLFCAHLRVRFGLSTKFVDHAGRPRLSFVVDASPSLCRVLDACDAVAQKLFVDSDSSSDWRPVVTRKREFANYPSARLQIPTVINGGIAQYATEIYQKDASGVAQKLMFSKFDATELEAWLTRGTLMDSYISLEPYDYQQSAGIRLVAKKLIILN